ncbi:2OG-Fe(II) oxygenase [Pseudorhodoferax soli]|uniref:Fe2OG dioxygenase domain-containing protein n=1 Tax=Pseudorhodoferax soli TaxID=545864 RepID=A0A368Y2T5_9BURK|nr:2OG-Fe(II) oxygenase [Pseudorhodoferax soli]RCW74573.1 hypothetical protein DES41_102896 [Pseudorhodoferax soli]
MGARVAGLDWTDIAAQLNTEGWAVLSGLLDAAQIQALAALCARPGPWPGWVAALQAALRVRLTPVANDWHARLMRPLRHPATLVHGEDPQPQRLPAGADLPLQHGSAHAHAFPLQLGILLSTPGADFTGGAMVLTEQRPRMQSRPMVLPLRCGDIAVYAAAERPQAGARGDYTVRMRHGIARVRSGQRLGLALRLDESA